MRATNRRLWGFEGRQASSRNRPTPHQVKQQPGRAERGRGGFVKVALHSRMGDALVPPHHSGFTLCYFRKINFEVLRRPYPIGEQPKVRCVKARS